MKKPTYDAFYYGDLAVASQAKVAQLETWITRDHFVPAYKTVPGRSRMFTLNDACRAAIMAYVINRCGLPIAVGADIADLLNGGARWPLGSASWSLISDLFDPNFTLFIVVFPDAAHHIKGRRAAPAQDAHEAQNAVEAYVLARGWKGDGSVSDVLSTRDPMGAIVVNMSRIACETRERLYKHIDAVLAEDDRWKAVGHGVYDDTEE